MKKPEMYIEYEVKITRRVRVTRRLDVGERLQLKDNMFDLEDGLIDWRNEEDLEDDHLSGKYIEYGKVLTSWYIHTTINH